MYQTNGSGHDACPITEKIVYLTAFSVIFNNFYSRYTIRLLQQLQKQLMSE